MKVFSDILGDYIEIPDDELRIVSIAPSVTETLFSLGLGDNIVGVSYFCNKPREVKGKNRVGGYLSVDQKALDNLNPDVVFATTGIQRKVVNELYNKKYPVYPVPLPLSPYGIIENIFLVAGVVRRHMKAVELSSRLNSILMEIHTKVYATVYYEIDFGEPYTIGANTYISNGLLHIGLKNIFGEVFGSYFKPDFELVIKSNPDVLIFEKHPARRELDLDNLLQVLKHRGWDKLKAYKNNRIILLEPDSLAHYGPTHIQTLSELHYMVKEMLGD
jgi:ABC-type Fe3+-hydroxamate transport system substrate-binding protein